MAENQQQIIILPSYPDARRCWTVSNPLIRANMKCGWLKLLGQICKSKLVIFWKILHHFSQ